MILASKQDWSAHVHCHRCPYRLDWGIRWLERETGKQVEAYFTELLQAAGWVEMHRRGGRSLWECPACVRKRLESPVVMASGPSASTSPAPSRDGAG